MENKLYNAYIYIWCFSADISNYRPISIIRALLKLMESILVNKFRAILVSKSISQHGFNSRYTLTNLLMLSSMNSFRKRGRGRYYVYQFFQSLCQSITDYSYKEDAKYKNRYTQVQICQQLRNSLTNWSHQFIYHSELILHPRFHFSQ